MGNMGCYEYWAKCADPKIKEFAFKRIQINNDNDD